MNVVPHSCSVRVGTTRVYLRVWQLVNLLEIGSEDARVHHMDITFNSVGRLHCGWLTKNLLSHKSPGARNVDDVFDRKGMQWKRQHWI